MGDKDGTTAYLFQLQRRQPGCLYTEVVLLRKRLVQGQLGWEVIGYRNPADQKSGRHDQALACPLMRSN